jgi:peptidoglycan/xylan/chitin deacetylase (PgdA/CDA1 family)
MILAVMAGPRAATHLAASGKAIILDYHTFLGNRTSNIDYSEKELADELDAMAALGYRFVSLDDAVAGRLEGRANIVITIDDGNHSVYQAFEDVFKQRGIKPYLFVYPAIIKGRMPYALSPQRLRELAAEGCGVGSHGYNHSPLTDKSWDKDPRQFRIEAERPGPAIAKLLGSPPTMFAYPYGVYSKRAEEAIAAAGYSWAFAGDELLHEVDFSDPALDHMAVPRTIVYGYLRKQRLNELKLLLSYDGPPLFEALPPADLLPGEVAR